MAAFQTATLDKPGSDCGSTGYIEVEINKDTKGYFTYRYLINDDGSLTLLTEDNIKDYMGKTVKLRSPMFCCSDKYCSKCFGELYYLMGMSNVGILANRIGTRLLSALGIYYRNIIN